MLAPLYSNAELQTTPKDENYPTGTQSDQTVWLEVANLSPYVFELRDEAQSVRAVVGAFTYYGLPLKPFTPVITFHAVATTTVLPIASTSYLVYAGLTKIEPSTLGQKYG